MQKKEFQNMIWAHYRAHKREFPWRETYDPYAILVSEIMLQQTQPERVIPKYRDFLNEFPDFESLAKTSLTRVLSLWSGLGYNRRAKYLHTTAQIVASKYNGQLTEAALEREKLPGIGKYTAAAVAAFAFNKKVVFIETNIRRVFIYHFFPNEEKVADKDIIPLIEKTLPKSEIREWYYALMDYGAMLGKTVSNPNRRSKHYGVQSKFEGSRRQLRGKLIRLSLQGDIDLSHPDLRQYNPEHTIEVLQDLQREGLID